MYNSSNSSRRRKTSGRGVYQSHNRSRRRRHKDRLPLVAAAIAVVIIIIAALLFAKRHGATDAETGTDVTETSPVGIIRSNAVIDISSILPDNASDEDKYVNIKGMTPQAVIDEISSRYTWSLCVVNKNAEVGSTVKQTVDANATTEVATMGDADNPDNMMKNAAETESDEMSVEEKVEIPDLIAASLPLFLDKIAEEDELKASIEAESETETESEKHKKGFFSKKETEEETESLDEAAEVYTFTLGDIDEDTVLSAVKRASSMWYIEPHGGSIGSYDKASDSFVMEGSRAGYKVDEDKLASEIRSAVSNKEFTKSIDVPGTVLSAESNITVGDYKTLASFTTNTTSNSVRNKNIELACNALNGTIVRPGEEFSFNNTVGQRTEAKGYGAAAAYNNGEVVQEVGGGVCQVSSTLYNAVLKAGLKITARQSHTIKPSYVTPGQEATISWGGPDFKFANIPAIAEYSNSESYAIGIKASYYKQTVTVSIYGRPVLKDGYSYSLSSEQIKELDLVRELIPEGSDKQPTKGSKGSVWETKLIVKKGDETVSSKVDHKAYYAGHKEYYVEETTPDPNESSSEESGSQPESISDTSVPEGPGGIHSAGVIGPSDSSSSEGSDFTQGPPAGGNSSSSAEPGAPGNDISDVPGSPNNN